MIELSPKALRFACLVAEEQPGLSDDPHIQDIRRGELSHSAKARTDSAKYISISDETARFCLNAIERFLQSHDIGSSPDWDGNDLQFLESIKEHLSRSLASEAVQGDRQAD